jgi:hypothetical protein
MTRFFLSVIALCLLVNPALARERFFPEGSLSSRADASERMEAWFSEHLLAMHERPLFPAPYGSEIFRFTWLRSFHNPMTFRLVVNPLGGGILYATKNSGNGGFKPGVVLEAQETPINAIEVAQFQKRLSEIGFWYMPRFDEENHGLDGARWILESTRSGVHYFVMRQSPGGTEFQKVMIEFMNLSGMDLGEIY